MRNLWCGVVCLMPEMFQAISESGMTKRALQAERLVLSFFNPRDYATDVHRTVDDKPYGGGPGMLLKVEPVLAAIEAAKLQAPTKAKVIFLSAQGAPLKQAQVMQFASDAEASSLILVAGRYEGFDERLITLAADMQISIGDYILTGGELAAMVLIDSITRCLPSVLGHPDSAHRESFTEGRLEYPQYTRPESFRAHTVPGALLSGDHARIDKWRRRATLQQTLKYRPDLLAELPLSDAEKALLALSDEEI